VEPVSLQDGAWKTWRDKMQTAVSKGEFEAEQALFQEGASRLDRSSTFGFRLATWSWVHDQMNSALGAAARIRPKREPGEVPISKNLGPSNDEPARQLSELWRSYVGAADPEGRREARARLESFYATEDRLTAEWEALRRREAARPLGKALFYGEFALQLLPALVSETDRSEAHPLLRRLYDCASTDCARLARRTAERVEAIRRDLSGADRAI
jgi:hypothetical protein